MCGLAPDDHYHDPTLSTFCSHWVITEGPLTLATLPQTWGIVTIMTWSLRNCHLNTLFLNSTAIGPITRGSKHLNLTALIWHQSRSHGSCDSHRAYDNMTLQWITLSCKKGLRISESESRMLWGVVVKDLGAPVIELCLTFMEHFQSRTMFWNFVSHRVSTL